jgi:hypothetical protein
MLQEIRVQINEAGDYFTTTPFQLSQWRTGLKLEHETGMSLSRGQKVSTHLRKLFGWKRSVKISTMYNAVCQIQKDVDESLGLEPREFPKLGQYWKDKQESAA